MSPRWKTSADSARTTWYTSRCFSAKQVGELFKAIRKHQNMRTGTTSIIGSVDEELADVLIYLCAIANRLDISLEEALRKKEAVNETRSWI
ncbi:MazG nucleotide pyrophosphohydrolase domain-containing protein [Amycolatopsis speibonae]|uniref:MazG nucleotide pyrophosphohydrolase domain-containing protein n=1 Tax=Amycolatopsis speibonae TaxID=1450224 RepID=A0ABV7P1S3_9PSEU